MAAIMFHLDRELTFLALGVCPSAPGRHRSAQPAHHRRGGRDARARERGLRRRPAGDAGDAGHPGLHPRGRGAPALHERERAQPGRGASSLHAPDLLLGRGQPGDRPRHRGGGVGRRPPRARRLPDRRQPGGVHLLPGLALRAHQQHVPGLRAGAERPGRRAARPRHARRGARTWRTAAGASRPRARAARSIWEESTSSMLRASASCAA